MITPEKEIEILERISSSKSTIRQRDLARIIGLSLGMTNSILKRLAKKGFLQIKKVNNRNIQYVVSPQGMEAISRKSYGYLKRTIKNVVYYKEAIDSLIKDAVEKGFRRLLLVGNSDLDFIIEHFCTKHRLEFVRTTFVNSRPAFISASNPARTFVLYSENIDPAALKSEYSANLRILFMSRALTPAEPAKP